MSIKVDIQDIMAWENGELSEIDEIKMFSSLVKSGMAWQLQGMYGRNAMAMIQNGILSKTGEILVNLDEIYE